MKVCEFLENLESKTEMYFHDDIGNDYFGSSNITFCKTLIGDWTVTKWCVTVDACLMVWIVPPEDNNE